MAWLATSRNRRETTASATRLSENALKTFPRPRRNMYQPCHLFSPATVPCRLSTAPALRRSAATSVAQGRGAAPNSVPTVSAVSTGLDLLSPSDERLRRSGQASSGAHSYPAPTASLRQHNIHGRDAHRETRRSGDQCTRGPLQTPSDGATPRRTRTQSVLGEGFLIVRSHPPIDRNRSKSPPTAGGA